MPAKGRPRVTYTDKAASVVEAHIDRLDFGAVLDALAALHAGRLDDLDIRAVPGRDGWSRIIVGDWRITMYRHSRGVIVADLVTHAELLGPVWPIKE